MLPFPNLNDQQFEDIMKNALNQTKKYGNSWKDIDIHDPGVTILELLAFFKEDQQSHINNVGVKSFFKFVELLGLQREVPKPAKTHVCFQANNQIIPKGTKLKAYDVVFETLERIKVLDNHIVALGYQNDEEFVLENYDLEELERDMPIFSDKFPEKNEFYIAFEQPLPKQETVHLYFDLYDEYEQKRNPITNPEEFVPLSLLKWEYFGEEEGVLGWHELEIENDETYDFLYSGNVIFKLLGEQKGLEGYEGMIRITVLQYGYEVVPKVKAIKLNALSLRQQDTKCVTVTFSYSDFQKNQMFFDEYLAREDCYNLYIKKENAWVKAEDLDVLYMIRKEEEEYFRLGISNREFLAELFHGFDDKEAIFQLVLYEKEFYFYRVLGSSMGTIHQEFQVLLPAQENILYDSFELMVAQEQNWNVWNKIQNLDKATGNSYVYTLAPKDRKVVFGNNKFGRVPYIGTKNIILTSCCTTLAEHGNLRKGILNSFAKKDEFKEVKIEHLTKAIGGTGEESLEHLKLRALHAMEDIERVVTVEDYEVLAKQTQGLMIENVTVVPLYSLGSTTNGVAENAVTVVVEPYGTNLSCTSYVKNVERKLKKAKLLTTKLSVTLPKYLGLEIEGELVVNQEEKQVYQMIDNLLKTYIQDIQKKKEDNIIYYADVCGLLERQEAVQYVKYLKLEISREATANMMGDLKIPPCAKVYLKSNHLRMVTK